MADLIPDAEALHFQLAAIVGREPGASYLEIRCLYPDGRPGPRDFIPVSERRRAADVVLALDQVNAYVGAAPRVRESGTARDVERVWTAWIDADTPQAVERLRAFQPRPAIVVATSPGRVQAFWPLRSSIAPSWARRANRRLAYALAADAAATDPARIVRAVGSRNHKREPSSPVRAVRVELDSFELGDVIGRLPDAPGEVPRRLVKAHTSGDARYADEASIDGLLRTVREAQEGNRNNALYWAAASARDERRDDAREALRQAALEAGLPEPEIERTLESAWSAAA